MSHELTSLNTAGRIAERAADLKRLVSGAAQRAA
jgi:hypothetical protein